MKTSRLVYLIALAVIGCSADRIGEGSQDSPWAEESGPEPKITMAATGGYFDWCNIGPCPEFVLPVDWNRAWFDSDTRPWTGRTRQLEPIEVLFPHPATNLKTVMWGTIPCVGTFGDIETFDAAGVSMGVSAYHIDWEPCVAAGYTGRVVADINAPRPVARVRIKPPTPLLYTVPGAPGTPGTIVYGFANPAFAFHWSTPVAKPSVTLESTREALAPVVAQGGIFDARQQTAGYNEVTIEGTDTVRTFRALARRDSVLLTAKVLSASGAPLQGTVVFIARAVDSTGGHTHNPGDRPAGRFFALGQYSPTNGGVAESTTVALDGAGNARVIYRASGVSGSERLIVRYRDGAEVTSDTVTLTIAVAGLQRLVPTATLDTIGVTDSHPSPHWGTPAMNTALRALADSLGVKRAQLNLKGLLGPEDRWPETFKINDMSLQFGGLLDFRVSWQNPHLSHRNGVDADVDVRRASSDDEMDRWVRFYWITQLGHSINNERQCCNHQHLDF